MIDFSTHNQIPRAEPPTASWMITFADLLSLLLTFFVLLFSMSTVHFESWKSVVATMTDEFNPNRPKIDITRHELPDHLKKTPAAGLNLNYLKVLFERAIADQAALDGSVVTLDGGTVIISVPAELLFLPKQTQLITGASKPLQQLAGTLVQIENKLKIAGHTNSAPIRTRKYRSNWELSIARARIVAGILTESGYKHPITVLGYADTGVLPVRARREKTSDLMERIDIVIITDRREKGPYDVF
ncbi:MAG: OmpA family protein [Kordiimonadaceae bacterium]|nr:OmpA family protein [Kordiimonadaceae bacterium]